MLTNAIANGVVPVFRIYARNVLSAFTLTFLLIPHLMTWTWFSRHWTDAIASLVTENERQITLYGLLRYAKAFTIAPDTEARTTLKRFSTNASARVLIPDESRLAGLRELAITIAINRIQNLPARTIFAFAYTFAKVIVKDHSGRTFNRPRSFCGNGFSLAR